MRHFIFPSLLMIGLHLSAQPLIMFPGDTNNDGFSNQYDLLPIGIAYGQEGIPRPNPTLDWIPQFLPMQWQQNLPVSGVNLGFCDSDGNGFIDSLDIDAIALNFDSVQLASQPPPMPYFLPDTCFSCPNPTLRIEFDRDTAMVSDTFYALISITYPPNLPQQLGALGIAFELSYEPGNVKDSLTMVFPDTMPGDLMFVTATSTLAKSWRSVPSGKIGFAAAGKGENALYFERPLGVVQIVVDDMILRSTAEDFWMDITDILILNEQEQVISPHLVMIDTVVLFDPVDATGEVWNEDAIILSPNPTNNWLNVHSSIFLIENIECLDVSGHRWPLGGFDSGMQARLDVNSLPPNPYFLKIQTSNGLIVRKFLKLE